MPKGFPSVLQRARKLSRRELLQQLKQRGTPEGKVVESVKSLRNQAALSDVKDYTLAISALGRVGRWAEAGLQRLTFSYTLLEHPWKRISHAPAGGESQLRAVPESSRQFGEIMVAICYNVWELPKALCFEVDSRHVIGVPADSFLPHQVAEELLCSMQLAEKASFLIDLEAFGAALKQSWLQFAAFERVDVERIQCNVELQHVRRGPEAIDLVQHVLQVGNRSEMTLRWPLWQEAPEAAPIQGSRCVVTLELEAFDLMSRPTSKRVLHCRQGSGELPDCVELALAVLGPKQRAELRCAKAPGLAGWPDASAPALFRVAVLNRTCESAECHDLEQQLREDKDHAGALLKGNRPLLALLKLAALSARGSSASPLPTELQRECLQLRCVAELRLGFASAEASAAALLDEHGRSCRHLNLHARAIMARDPSAAVDDLLAALQLKPGCATTERLLKRAERLLERAQRAQRWFDGRGAEKRTAEARSALLCFQCGRLRSDGHVGEAGSKMADRYLCEECWSCFRKIRRCQQLELDRRVEKATYSDYSTATDELPSLEDVPQDWDRRHPMWQRSNETNPDWQLLRPKNAVTKPESFALVD
ncbi:PLGG1 [Symbiodinium sp. CCMP2592]|nr:PLGG1 [Symbiodinium sp. CCMP2592]